MNGVCSGKTQYFIMADIPIRCESRRRPPVWLPLARSLLRVLDKVPTNCPLCRGASRGGAPCPGCLDDMSPPLLLPRCGLCALALARGLRCPDCAALRPAFDRVVAAFDYQPPVDQLILQLKNAARFQHARYMAAALAEAVDRAVPPVQGITILLPVPSSRQALRRRGFNPAGEIARQVAARLGLPYRPGALRRVGEGVSQKRLGRAARTGPDAARYACTQRLDGEVVAVIDDVLTTGATMHAIALALKQAGAAQVVGLVVARTPYRQEP